MVWVIMGPASQAHSIQELLPKTQPQPRGLPPGLRFPCTHLANVGVIQGSVNLIQDEEGGWLVAEREPVGELTLMGWRWGGTAPGPIAQSCFPLASSETKKPRP